MKCYNCGEEFEGKFCPNCGTPASAQPTQSEQPAQPEPSAQPVQQEPLTQSEQPIQTEQSFQPEQPVQPEQPIQTEQYAGQPYQNNYEQQVAGQPNQGYQNQQFTNQPNPGYTGQQFTNQPNQGYNGQQFTNQPTNGVAPNGKKPMSTGKILGIVFGIVGGVLVLLAILFIVAFSAACNKLKQNDTVNRAVSALGSSIDKYESIFKDDLSSYIKDYSSIYYSDQNEFDAASGLYYKRTADGIVIEGYEYEYDYTASVVKERVNINIPEQIDGIDVVEIAEMYFYIPSHYDTYVTVTIPGTVEIIDDYAFAFSSKLNEVIIEDGVEEIGQNAFFDNENLTKVYVPASVSEMDDCGFGFCYGSDDMIDEITVKNFVMTGEKGSAAERYCKENKLTFEVR